MGRAITSTKIGRKPTRTIGELIDAHYALTVHKKNLEEQIRSIRESMEALEGEALEQMDTQGLTSGKGMTALGRVEEKEHFNIGDYKKFVGWIKKNDKFELFQNRVSSTAYRELVAAGHKPAGVTVYKEVKFTTTKRRK